MGIEDLIKSGTLAAFDGGKISGVDASRPLLALNPRNMVVEADTTAPVKLVIVHTQTNEASVELRLGENAQLSLTEVYLAEAFAEVRISQASGSRCRIVTAELRSANVAYRINLEGRGAENELSAVFVASDSEHCTIDLTTNHLVSDCKSDSLVKGVASGRSTGEFRGLVYVAQDAQRTDAQQQSRNIEMGDAHIVTMPQLEIYADDVRCSHGATVGQLDDDAVLYMRQRGLSEKDARRLQTEGFVNDVANRCDVEEVAEMLAEEIAAKLERL